MPPPPRPPSGVVFPPGPKDDRSTTWGNQQVWAASFRAMGDSTTADAVLAEKNWRFNYHKYLKKHVVTSLRSTEIALKGAQAGIDKFYEDFEFIRDGSTYKMKDLMSISGKDFETGTVGNDDEEDGEEEEDFDLLEVPYKSATLKCSRLQKQAEDWERKGIIEPSTAQALKNVAKNDEWSDLSDQYFVLLGAGAAMGPFLVLMALGANVIACDLNRSQIWEKLIKVARSSPGTLTFPLSKPQSEIKDDDDLYKSAGCDLLNHTPEIARWVCNVMPKERLTIGSYVYLDGGLFVRVSLACDSIMKELCAKRPDTRIAFLCTPTDCHVIPEEASKNSLARYNSMNWRNLLVLPIRALSSKMLVKNAQQPVTTDNGEQLYFVDGIVVAQGPNYALAKRMQHWRAITAYSKGHVVSSNIAPSTATISVIKNKQFAWAYDGMPYFKPMEIFQQETSNAVMAALLINDINEESQSVADPKSRAAKKLRNPYELFAYNSFHGGVWRCAYTVGSIGEVSVIIHFIKVARMLLFILLALVVLLIAYKWFY